jgi:PAS domain S-box-containing protein
MSPDLVYVLDSKGRFSFLQGACEKIVGCPPRDLVGRHFTEIIFPEDAQKAQWRFNERRTGRRATRGHKIRLRSKNVRRCHVQAPRATAVRVDASGIWTYAGSVEERCFLGTIGVAKDMTSRFQERTTRQVRRRFPRSIAGMLDEEKSKIAAELHDNVGQLLVSIKMDLERIKAQVDLVPGPMNQWVEAAIGKSVEAIKDLREIAHGLKPVSLESMDLVTALHNLFGEIMDRSGIKIHFFHEKVPMEMDFTVKHVFYRIAQEALTNVLKHSKATSVHLNLLRRGDTLAMTVEDDGIGFNMDPRRGSDAKPGLGLLIMEERAARMRGEFCIESSRGEGTHLLVEIPLW